MNSLSPISWPFVLKAWLVCDQRFKQRLAIGEPKARDVPTLEMQEIESVIDEQRGALAIGRRLRLGEARQTSVVDATEFAVGIGGLYVQVRECGDGARIFVCPVEPGAGEQLDVTVLDARSYSVAVEFDFVQPLRPRRRLLDRRGKLGRDEARKGDPSARRDRI